jgi:hypothetical protein
MSQTIVTVWLRKHGQSRNVCSQFVNLQIGCYIQRMDLTLSDEEQQALAKHLHKFLDYHRYPFSREIQPLKAVLEKIDPTPKRPPAPPAKVYAPPRATAKQRR